MLIKIENILKVILDSIPSPSLSMKIQIIGRKVFLRCTGKTLLGIVNILFVLKSLLTSPSNVLTYFPPIIWIFTKVEGDGIESRLSSLIFSKTTIIKSLWKIRNAKKILSNHGVVIMKWTWVYKCFFRMTILWFEGIFTILDLKRCCKLFITDDFAVRFFLRDGNNFFKANFAKIFHTLDRLHFTTLHLCLSTSSITYQLAIILYFFPLTR